jgi:hypothetical protein
VQRPNTTEEETDPCKTSLTRNSPYESGVRAKVEHGVGVIKQVFGFVKVRYRGRQRTPNI